MTDKSFAQMIEKLSMEFTADMKRMEAVLDKVVLLIEAEHLPLRVVAILASHLAAASLKSIEDPQTRLRAFEAHAQVIACLLGIKTEMVVEV